MPDLDALVSFLGHKWIGTSLSIDDIHDLENDFTLLRPAFVAEHFRIIEEGPFCLSAQHLVCLLDLLRFCDQNPELVLGWPGTSVASIADSEVLALGEL